MRGRRSGLKHTEFFLILIAIYLLVGETGLCDRVEECTPVEGGQLLDLMGSRFVLFEDVMQAPGFKTVTRWTEEQLDGEVEYLVFLLVAQSIVPKPVSAFNAPEQAAR
eukprot:402418-Rhodomonas_salina.1